MKFKISVVTILLLSVLIVSAGCIGEGKETYKIGVTDQNNILLNVDLATGEFKGASIDLFNWVADDLDANVEYVKTKDYISDLNNGVIDVISFARVTDESKKDLDFTNFEITVGYGFVAKKSSDMTVDDILSEDVTIVTGSDERVALVLKNYLGEDKYNKMLNDGKIIAKITENSALVDVEDKKADVCFGNTIALSHELMERKNLKYIGSVGEDLKYAPAVKKGNTKLLDTLNKAFSDFISSGELDSLILDKYCKIYLKDTYTVGMNKDYPPFSYLDENGEPTGFDVESLKWIADKYGFNVEYEYMPWSSGIYAVENYNIDMFYSALSITDERSTKVTFTNPYYSVGNAVAQKKGSGFNQKMFENGEIIIGVIDGTTPAEWLSEFFGEEKYLKMIEDGVIKLYPDSDSRLNAFLNGETDVIFSNTPSVKNIADNYSLDVIAVYTSDELYGAAVQNGDPFLIETMNKGLADLESSGKKAELLKKYNLD